MKVLYWSAWFLIRVTAQIAFRIRVTGKENIPQKGGFILAANHISYFDPPLIGSCSPRELYFFAKKELFEHRLFGRFLQRVNTFPVRRGAIDRHALEMAVDAVKSGHGLMIFPEGTRSRQETLLDPKPGVGMIAQESACPIVPCYLHGTNRLSGCLRGRQRLRVTFGEPLPAAWVASFPKGKNSYMEIARAVMTRISRLKDYIFRENTEPGH